MNVQSNASCGEDTTVKSVSTLILPQKPERPLDSDCCGQGCVPCVLDLYEQELEIWREECHRVISGESAVNKPVKKTEVTLPFLSVTEYRSFTIESVQKETEDSFRFRFSLPHDHCLGLKTGQHVVIRGEVDGENVTRQYTPISDIQTSGYFEILIKLYSVGKMSSFVRTWSVKTQVDMRGPFGSWMYKPNQYRCVLMLAVGTGIAPMSQVIQTILNNDDDETNIKLMYGCRTYEDILLQTELVSWRRYWNFSQLYCLSQERTKTSPTQYRYGEKIHHGRLTKDHVQSVVSDCPDQTYIFICGTRSFEKDMIDLMSEIGVDKEKFHKF